MIYHICTELDPEEVASQEQREDARPKLGVLLDADKLARQGMARRSERGWVW